MEKGGLVEAVASQIFLSLLRNRVALQTKQMVALMKLSTLWVSQDPKNRMLYRPFVTGG